MKIAVLLTCHNRKSKTKCCLQHLFAQLDLKGSSLDVYLVDDGCTDGTSDMIKELFPAVHIIKGDGSLFWNRGMCLAWQESRKDDQYDAVLWLNDDTMLFPTALSLLLDYYSKNEGCIIVGSIGSTNDHTTITYGGLNNNKIVLPVEGEYPVCETFNGNCVLIPSVVSDKIGYLDPYYRHSVGDFDYALRAYKAGVKNIVAPIVGVCDRNPSEPIWNKGTLFERFKRLYSPLGNNPFETFHYCKKDSLFKAFFYFTYIHVRVLLTFIFPKR